MTVAEAIEFLKEQGYAVIRKDRLKTCYVEQSFSESNLALMAPDSARHYITYMEKYFADSMGYLIARELDGILKYKLMPKDKDTWDVRRYRAELTIVVPADT